MRKTLVTVLLAMSIANLAWSQVPVMSPSRTNNQAASSHSPNLRPEAPVNAPLAYINDFRVNNENYNSAFRQNQADLACSRWPMTAWVAWTDGRSPNLDIYVQRFDSLMNKRGSNIKVNDDTVQYHQSRPDIDCDSVGNAVVVWYDGRLPSGWGQRFDKNGNRLGVNFKLRKDTVNLDIRFSAVAVIEGQGFVTVSSGYHTVLFREVIMAQHFDGNGNYGPHYYVDTTTSGKGMTACGWGGDRIVYAWFDNRNGFWNVYARVYDLSGVPLGPAFRVTEPATVIGDAYNWKPALAVGDTGQFCIAWQDFRNGNGDIYAQRYDRNGVPQGGNFKVNQDVGTAHQAYPQAYYVKDGPQRRFLLITFSDNTSGRRILGSMYNISGGLVFSSPFIPTDGFPDGFHRIELSYRPSITRYVGPIAWDANISGNRDVYTKDVYSTAHAIRCNSDSMGANQIDPCVAADSLGRWIVLWTDERRPDKGLLVYARGYNPDGSTGTMEILLSDTLKSKNAQSPCQAINPAGDYILAWRNDANITGVWGRIGGALMSPNIRLSADTTNGKYLPAAAIDSAGNFVLCWLDMRNANRYDLYCRGFLAGAIPTTATDVRVNLAGTICEYYTPRVLSLGSMRFAFIYVLFEGGKTNLYCRLAELTGSAINFLGDPFRVSDNPAGVSLSYFGAAAGPTGNFIVGWHDYGYYNLKARWFDRNGNPLGASFAVNDNYSFPQYINIAIDRTGRTAIVWGQWFYTEAGNVYARLYNADRTPYTEPFKVNADPTAYYQGRPAVTAAVGKFYFVWEDGRLDTCGTDIFAKGYTWEELGVASGLMVERKVGSLKLLPNVPNPFNRMTTIRYQITKPGKVSLKVYNVAGQCVKTLVSEFRVAGSYEVCWDGRDEGGRQVANGAYIYRLSTDEGSLVGKMNLIR